MSERHIASNEAIRVISYVGLQNPIHCTANGKAHLSMVGEQLALDLIGSEPKRFTPKTLTDPKKIMTNIAPSRNKGVFSDDEKYDEGASALAVPLPQIGGKDFAFSIAMPTSRMKRQRETVKSALLTTRDKVVFVYGKNI